MKFSPPRIAFGRFVVACLAVCSMALVASCGDDGSDKSPVQATEETSSSSVIQSSSAQNVFPDSVGDLLSSSSKKSSAKDSVSSSSKQKDKKSSSSKDIEPAEMSSSERSSSSSVKSGSSAASSSSKDTKLAEESSSSKGRVSSSSSEIQESSSSVKIEESSCSANVETSSSSEKPVEFSSSEKVVESSSSEKPVESSSSAMSIYDAENNTLTDLRDNQVYKTVTIGEQTWMAENLNYMPEDTAGTIYSGRTVCGGGEYKSQKDSEKCDIFGRLYLRKVALNKTTASNRQGICPDGWSIPKKEDWEKLISHLGENVVSKIKGDFWESNPGTNESGFSAIPTGNYNNSVIGYDNLSWAYFFYWNSKSDPYFLRIRDEENDLYYSYGASYMMYSVRCLKD